MHNQRLAAVRLHFITGVNDNSRGDMSHLIREY